MPEDFVPRKWLDLWESVFCVVGVHGENLFARGCAQNFDYFNELVDPGLAWEDWLAEHEFSDYTTDRPHVDVGPVVRISKDQLWCSVVT